MHRLFLFAAICFIYLFPAAATPALACPDKINCIKVVGGTPGGAMTYSVGTINWPTCYKFLEGCRPRFCDNAHPYSDQYWDNRCKERFPNKCINDRGENECRADFPVW